MSTSLSSLLRQLAQDLFPDRYVEFTALAAAESTATVVAGTELRHGTASTQSLAHGWYYIYGGTAVGDERQVAAYAPTASSTYGTITLARPCSATPGVTSTGLVYNGGLAPSQLIRHINRALRTSRSQRLRAHTLVDDGLMETSSASAWTDSGTTSSKVTSGVYEGGRALSVVGGGGGNYAVTATAIAVVPGDEVVVEATARVATATGTREATLVLYDATNSTALLTLSTPNRAATRLKGSYTIPAGCFTVTLRLGADTASTDAVWDEVLLWRSRERLLYLPTDLNSVEDVYNVWQRTSSDGDPALGGRTHRVSGWKVRPDPTAATPFVLDLTSSDWSGGDAVLVDALLPWSELSAATDTTNADQDDVLLRARAYAYAQLAKIGPRDERSFYKQAAADPAATWATRASRQPRPARPVTGPTTGRYGPRGRSVRRWWLGNG